MSEEHFDEALANDMALDAEAQSEESGDKLERVTKMAELLARQERNMERLKEELQAAKDAYNQTRMVDLPELMTEVGLKSMTLEDGAVVEIRSEVDAAITAAKKPMALRWLTEHGFGGLIKTKVVAEFPANERERAVECNQALAEEYEGVTMDEAVHPATLKSFVKERLQNGEEIPMELFSVHPYHVAKLKRAK